MPPTPRAAVIKIKEVAELAGVAPSSVSRALNDHPDVSPAMKARVLKAAEQLGYLPNFPARGLRSGVTRTVGFVVRDISIVLFAGIVMGAEQEFERHGYSILLTNSRQDPKLEARHIEVLRQHRVDGLILSLQSEANMQTLSALRNVQVPVVLLDRELSGVATDSVVFDHVSGVHDAVSALLKLGHRKIALLVGSAETRATRCRIQGYALAHERARVPVNWGNVIRLDTTASDAASSAVAQLLDLAPPPTAIVAGDAPIGVCLLRELSRRRLRPGRDLSMVVCDDHELFRFMDSPVSVVYRDPVNMGIRAAQLLLERLTGGPREPVCELLPTIFLPRATILAPAGC